MAKKTAIENTAAPAQVERISLGVTLESQKAYKSKTLFNHPDAKGMTIAIDGERAAYKNGAAAIVTSHGHISVIGLFDKADQEVINMVTVDGLLAPPKGLKLVIDIVKGEVTSCKLATNA